MNDYLHKFRHIRNTSKDLDEGPRSSRKDHEGPRRTMKDHGTERTMGERRVLMTDEGPMDNEGPTRIGPKRHLTKKVLMFADGDVLIAEHPISP